MSKITNFNINVSMEERWVPYFVSFLKRMEADGRIGHSEMLGFFADGDGDFRPSFAFEPFDLDDIKVMKRETKTHDIEKDLHYFDAG